MPKHKMDMHFCRRCGAKLIQKQTYAYVCEQGHKLYLNPLPAVGLALVNDKQEVLVLERAVDPAKGLIDLPGGFCDGEETYEQAIARELEEEMGLLPADYGPLRFVLSAIDMYEYEGERLPVLVVNFTAKMRTNKPPTAGDDAATATWIPLLLHELKPQDIAFDNVRATLAHLQKEARHAR